MCLTNNQKMTEDFPQEMKVYKILEKDTPRAPCMREFHYKHGWNEAVLGRETLKLHTDYGLHVLLDKEEAESLKERWERECKEEFFTIHEIKAYREDLIAAGYFHDYPYRYKSAVFRKLYLDLSNEKEPACG